MHTSRRRKKKTAVNFCEHGSGSWNRQAHTGGVNWTATAHLGVFGIVESSPPQFEVALLPPLERAGLLEQQPLLDAGLEGEQRDIAGMNLTPSARPAGPDVHRRS